MIGLTPKQRQLYDFIAARLRESGVAPSFMEMAAAMRVQSVSRVHVLVSALEERGYIRRLPHKARAIELVDQRPSVTLNTEILTLTDRYAAEHKISRDTAVNELLRNALDAA